MKAPYIPHALPSQTVFDFLFQRHNRLSHFISDIMDYFWAGEDQQQPISLATWLAVNPLTCNLVLTLMSFWGQFINDRRPWVFIRLF